ncbi:MAG: hypothetical protein JKY70_13410 [Mucilaginibacter sp.]|nr:hypothetical protein [Mucilaginibacter sp.]
MKAALISTFLICANLLVIAQNKLSEKDTNNLLALSNLYSHDNMFKADSTHQKADALRSPALNHVIDGLLAAGKADTSVIGKNILQRPANEELKLWYAIRSVHYNNIDTVKSRRRPALEVINNVLTKDVDERILLNNYYSMVFSSGIGFLFNEADLSRNNFDLETYGLKNETEKAILFFRLIDPMIRARFLVLQHMKNYERLGGVIKRLPTFNGQPYYAYTDFNFVDFDEDNLYKKETFKQFNINFLVQSELIQLNADAVTGKIEEGRALYHNSLLNKPEYFGFTATKDVLEKLYKQFNK